MTCSSSVGAGPSSLGRYELAPLPGVVVVPALGSGAGPALVPGERDHQTLGGDPAAPRYLTAPAFVVGAQAVPVHEEGIHSTLDLWDRAKVALVGIGAYPKPVQHVASASDGDPAIADATGDVVGRFFTDDGTLIHYPDEPRLLGITPDRMRRIPHVVGISVGADKARAIVGAARARLVNTLVTDAGTLRGGRPARRIGRSTTVGHLAPRSPASSMPPRHGSGSSAVASPSSPPMEPT